MQNGAREFVHRKGRRFFMSEAPIVVVGRKLPQAVEARLVRHYRPRLNRDDRLYSSEELLDLCARADAIVACHTEHLSAEVIARLPESLRVVANFSVGVDHVDLAAAKSRTRSTAALSATRRR